MDLLKGKSRGLWKPRLNSKIRLRVEKVLAPRGRPFENTTN